jgi:hypothetical protein
MPCHGLGVVHQVSLTERATIVVIIIIVIRQNNVYNNLWINTLQSANRDNQHLRSL